MKKNKHKSRQLQTVLCSLGIMPGNPKYLSNCVRFVNTISECCRKSWNWEAAWGHQSTCTWMKGAGLKLFWRLGNVNCVGVGLSNKCNIQCDFSVVRCGVMLLILHHRECFCLLYNRKSSSKSPNWLFWKFHQVANPSYFESCKLLQNSSNEPQFTLVVTWPKKHPLERCW